jgi:anti-sigma regulatory factor (Ser/Thr protein kinase)
MRIDSDPANLAAARKAIESFTVTCGLGEQASHDVGLCLNEALANVMRHAYGGRRDRPIVISAECDAEQLTVRVRDWGNGVDPSTLPHEPYNPLTPGGVGLICLGELLDRMVYTPQPDGMLATMVKKRR